MTTGFFGFGSSTIVSPGDSEATGGLELIGLGEETTDVDVVVVVVVVVVVIEDRDATLETGDDDDFESG